MKRYYIWMLALTTVFSSCNNYLNVVPDGTATIEMAFNMRSEAIKYLNTCYSYMPKTGNPAQDPALLGGDELCSFLNSGRMASDAAIQFSRGSQNATKPLLEKWDYYYLALRDCNIFLENVGRVPDLPTWEEEQWIAEVKTLKAYYHFCLIQMYGPIPLIKKNLPISSSVKDVKIYREPIDQCFDYVIQLLDEVIASGSLPLTVVDPASDLGRITSPIAHMLKAKVLVTAASPLFNANNDQKTLKNNDGTVLFNQNYRQDRWDSAVVACKQAIDVCHEAGFKLYKYQPSATWDSTTVSVIGTQMSLRLAFNERWNSDIIWANTQSIAGAGNTGLQQISVPKLNTSFRDAPEIRSLVNPTLKMTELFYTKNGVPITEDKTWDYSKRFNLRTAAASDRFYIESGATTIRLNFDREPRYYADLGFDCGTWFGQGKNDPNGELFAVHSKKGDTDGQLSPGSGPLTGLWAKKLVYYTNVLSSVSAYSCTTYPWPLMRLSDLYLLYAEAINEAEGPNGANSAEMFKYIDLVRNRAGLKGVKESWDNYATNTKYTQKGGMQQIIRQERMIELAFEGSRFWDIRRWKTAPDLYKIPVQGWDMTQSDTRNYYQTRVLYSQSFGIKDYFWPISSTNLIENINLVQNIGW